MKLLFVGLPTHISKFLCLFILARFIYSFYRTLSNGFRFKTFSGYEVQLSTFIDILFLVLICDGIILKLNNFSVIPMTVILQNLILVILYFAIIDAFCSYITKYDFRTYDNFSDANKYHILMSTIKSNKLFAFVFIIVLLAVKRIGLLGISNGRFILTNDVILVIGVLVFRCKYSKTVKALNQIRKCNN